MLPDEKQRLLRYLMDAFTAAGEMTVYTTGLSHESFYSNRIKSYIERGLEVISEALKRASIIEPNLIISDLQKIFATRNKIAHEYDIVDPLQLYNIVNRNIPILIEELMSLIEKTATES